MNTPTEQLRAAINYLLDTTSDISQASLADGTNTPRSYLNDFLKGRAPGKESSRVEWCSYFNYTYADMLSFGQWISDGKDPKEWTKPEAQNYEKQIPVVRGGDDPPSNFILIPKYKARLSGGYGSLEDSDQIESNLAFKKDWVSNKGSDNVALFEVVGDSMAPFIQEGDVVLVDMAQSEPEHIIDGKVFAIREDGTVKIKRLVHEGGNLIIRSQDRENFPDYIADKEGFQLIGRVIWLGHEVR